MEKREPITPEEFAKTPKLYHYTTIESACKILHSMQLRFAPLANMNDTQEAYRNILLKWECGDNPVDYTKLQEVENELVLYRQCSLTMDGCRHGFDIQSMWGHYADKGRGVCFVFNKKHLLSDADKYGITYRAINYNCKFDSDIKVECNQNIHNFLETQKYQLFFQKALDWEYEQEYRLIKKIEYPHETFSIPIDNALIAIILYYPETVKLNIPTTTDEPSIWDSLSYKILNSIIPPYVEILELSRWLGELKLTAYNNGDGKDIFTSVID